MTSERWLLGFLPTALLLVAACSELTVPEQVDGRLRVDDAGGVSVEFSADAEVAGCSVNSDLVLHTERSDEVTVVKVQGYQDADPASVTGADCTELRTPRRLVDLGLLRDGESLRLEVRLGESASRFDLSRVGDEITIQSLQRGAGDLACDDSGRRTPLMCADDRS